MSTPTWLTTAQKAQHTYAKTLPTKARYGLNMQAFFEHQYPANSAAARFSWHAPREIRLLPLSQAVKEKALQPYLQKHFQLAGGNSSRISAYTHSQTQEGIVIEIPADFEETKPCTLSIQSDSKQFTSGHVIIIAHRGSKISLITTHQQSASSSHNISAFIEEQAELQHIILDQDSPTPQFTQYRHYLEHHSQLLYLDLVIGNHHGEKSVQTYMQGPDSKAQHYHLNLLNKNAQYDLQSIIDHQEANTRSSLFTNAALENQSHMLYRGVIAVADRATDCLSEQKETTLMISPEAKINAAPILDIQNDQVHCSHSASTSSFDPNKLFYMESRGLTPAQTKKMLIHSFLQSNLAHIEKQASKTWIQDHLQSILAY